MRNAAKRKRRDSDNPIIIHCNSQQHTSTALPLSSDLVFPTTLLMACFNKSSVDLVKAYVDWLRVDATEEQEGHYKLMQHLTLHHGYDLDCIESNKKIMHGFYTEQGIPIGFAWRYIYSVTWFRKQKVRAMTV